MKQYLDGKKQNMVRQKLHMVRERRSYDIQYRMIFDLLFFLPFLRILMSSSARFYFEIFPRGRED